VIDLHLHTCASDGRSTPTQLVGAAVRSRLSTISVTDHDTVAGLDEAAAACEAAGVRLVTGIEITATRGETEVHVLGYFIDRRAPGLLAFLAVQQADRRRRLGEMLERLAGLGLRLEESDVFGTADVRSERGAANAAGGASAATAATRAVGRPLIARALVRAGHVRNGREAFDLYLAEGRPAFVARRAPSPEDVIGIVHAAGGLASVAHPALLAHDDWIPGLAAAGLDAIEAYYIEHGPEVVARSLPVADALGLAVTGGSDYHGDAGHGPQRPGDVVLPEDEFARLEARASGR
jgi:predicted metal-dependent phosphoesterase TrpH